MISSRPRRVHHRPRQRRDAGSRCRAGSRSRTWSSGTAPPRRPPRPGRRVPATHPSRPSSPLRPGGSLDRSPHDGREDRWRSVERPAWRPPKSLESTGERVPAVPALVPTPLALPQPNDPEDGPRRAPGAPASGEAPTAAATLSRGGARAAATVRHGARGRRRDRRGVSSRCSDGQRDRGGTALAGPAGGATRRPPPSRRRQPGAITVSSLAPARVRRRHRRRRARPRSRAARATSPAVRHTCRASPA